MKNLKLIVKLLGGYVIVAVLVLVVGYFGLTGARSLSADIRQIGRNILPKVNSLQILKEVQSAYGREEATVLRKDLDPLSAHDAYARMDSAKMRQDNAVQVYSALPRDKEEEALWQKLQQSLDAFWKSHQAFVDLAKAGGAARTADQDAQLNDQAATEDSQRIALGGILDQIIALENSRAASAVSAAESTSAWIRLIALIGLVAGPVLALLLGVALALSITRPVARSVAFAERISSGDLTQHLDLERHDEIGTLGKALNNMSARLAEMVGRVKENAENLAASSQQIYGSAQTLAEGAQNQASSLEETTASMEELDASVELVAEHAQSQASAAQEGTSSMTAALQTIETVSKNLDEISTLARRSVDNAVDGANAVKSVVEGISAIASSSEKISGIVTVISDIADQTNLLALNASIEAARAGENGRGFAVVADEVSKLADRSASSTKEIEKLIKESIRNVTTGVETARNTETAMEQIRDASRQVNGMIATVSESMNAQVASIKELAKVLANISDMSRNISASVHEQTTNARQVSQAVEGVNRITQSSAAAAEQMSSATEQLSRMAQDLRGLIGQFLISGDGKALDQDGQAAQALPAHEQDRV